MTKKERYEERKRMGLCPVCGKNRPLDGKVICGECNKLRQQNRDYKRKHNICVKCGRNKVAPNRKYCDECLEQRRARYQEQAKTKEYVETTKLYRTRHNQKYKENGLCLTCGKPVFENHTLCYNHLIIQRNNARRRRALTKEFKED